MPRKRTLKMDQYGISKYKLRELQNFCYQYPEWKKMLASSNDAYMSPQISASPKSITNKISDRDANLAVMRAQASSNCQLIEQTCIEAEPDIYQYLLLAVINENVSYAWLRDFKGIPCGINQFYQVRKKFYYLLSLRK